jgi:hypothetical protein
VHVDCCLQRHAHPPFARGLAFGEPLLEEEKVGVALRHRTREKVAAGYEKKSFPRQRFINQQAVTKRGRPRLREAEMRNALEKEAPPLRGDAERPVLNAMLRKQKFLVTAASRWSSGRPG